MASEQKSSFFWIAIILILIVSAVIFLGGFWHQSKEFSEKSVTYIKNMQNTKQKAADIKEKLNKLQQDQLNRIKNLEQ